MFIFTLFIFFMINIKNKVYFFLNMLEEFLFLFIFIVIFIDQEANVIIKMLPIKLRYQILV